MQLIAFDFGLRQIGVASGNSQTLTTSELDIVRAKNGVPEWQAIQAILQEWRPDLCLVGLPLNMDDSESQLSQRARRFARQIHGRFGYQVDLVDERLSSFEAKSLARESGHKGDYKTAPVDALAARILVEQWLANQKQGFG